MKSVALAAMVVLGTAAAAQEPVYKVGEHGIQAPKVTFEVKPRYTEEAMRAKIQGEVQLEAVIGTDGRPDAIKVTKSLDAEHGLDAEAIDALKRWRFEPSRKDGKLVRVQVAVDMRFTLRDHK